MVKDPHHLPDLRATHYDRGFEDAQIRLAQRMYALCCDRYRGPDPLGLGSGWCTTPANLPHGNHVDQFGRTWLSREHGTINP
jgi:hypothetical protein